MTKIEEAIRKRNSAKKKFDDEVKSFFVVLKARVEISRLEEAFDEVKTKYKAVRKLHDEITDLMIEAEVDKDDFGSHDNFIEEIMAVYGNLLTEFEEYRKFKEMEIISKTKSTEKEPKARSNLERIKVPQFSGNIKNYRTWKRIFSNTMEKNGEDQASQLARLIEAIQPPLRYEVECFTTTGAIWKFLDRLFGDDKELIRILMNDIKTMKPLKAKDTKSIRNFVATVRGCILRMEDVGATDETRSRYVFADILAKLTIEDQRAYGRSMIDTKKDEDLQTLLEYLEEESKLLASSQPEQRSLKAGVYPVNMDGVFSPNGCGLGCSQLHDLAYCPAFKKMKVKEKWDVVIQSKRCKKCLKTGHRHQQCSRKACDINNCGRPHHYLMHKDPKQDEKNHLNPTLPAFNPQGLRANKEETNQVGTISTNSTGTANVPIQRVNVRSTNGVPIEGLAMIDSGSNQSLIRKEFADRLGLVGETKKMKMYVAGGGVRVEDSAVFDLKISPCYDDDIVFDVKAYSVKKPCQATKTVSKKAVEQFPHLVQIVEDLHLSGGPVDILLGTDLPEAHRDFKVLSGNPGEPIAKKNIFGWTVLGHIEDRSAPGIFAIEVVDEIATNNDIQKLLFQDQLGIKPTRYCTCSEKEMKECAFIRHVRESTRVLDDGRIEVQMPWKPGHPNLPNNWSVAYKRMVSKEKQLIKKGKLQAFNQEVKALVDRAVVVKLQPDHVKPDEPAWYLPIGEVESPEKTTKCRLVFDSAAKMDGVSLNDALEKGPCLLNSLFDVLIGWRQKEIAFAGDISKMFNQVAVHPDDQKYHRFLWRDGETDREPDVYQWIRLSFGDKPAPDLAITAINILADKAKDEAPEAANTLKDHTYVDDIAGSETVPEKVKDIIAGIDAILNKGKFTIKLWHSNCREIDQAPDENPVNLLGHQWDKKADSISLKRETVKADLDQCTKRKALCVVSQLWDPLGLMAAVTIRFRIDLQNLWAAGYQWDEFLPPEEKFKWLKNLEIMNTLLGTHLKRCLKPKMSVGSPQLHGFSDGGESGYDGALFLRWELEDGRFTSKFVAAKALVAPLKKKTIPRLELMGCQVLSRLAAEVERALKVKLEEKFWCDSTTALSWIRSSPAEFKPFVSARVAEIQENQPKAVWNYIASEDNPADALTRGIKPEELQLWHLGPRFIQKPEHEWPDFERTCNTSESQSDSERKNKSKVKLDLKLTKNNSAIDTEVANNVAIREGAAQDDERIIDGEMVVRRNDDTREVLDRILATSSSFRKARRVTALVVRTINNIVRKKDIKGPVSVPELKDAERRLIKMEQSGMDVNAKRMQNLTPFMDEDGICRVKGRLENARNLPREMRNPIVLSSKQPLTKLLIQHYHQKLGHCGYKRLMMEVRQRYWVVGLRDLARNHVKGCIPCRMMRKKPFVQQMGQIPPYRTEASYPAFANTALDLFGPFEIKVGRKTIKEAWCCIFTCMTSRAVHLELCTDRSTDTFLMAFRRFSCLRGHPKFVWSDRGTNFVGAQKYLQEMVQNWDVIKIKTNLAESGTSFEWCWNIPKASHMNGVVESLIKSVRRALESSCKMVAYTEEQWRTFLAEITFLVNSRPLYPASDNIWEDPPITPNDLIIGTNFGVPQPEHEELVNPRHLNKSVQKRVDQFWQCWMKYFAPNLLLRSKWHEKKENVEVGDLVLEIDANRKRAKWQMALVEGVFPGSDDLVRKVKIRTSKGTYERPIAKLCLIATRRELEQKQ